MSPSIEETIDRVEQLYATITGARPPSSDGSTSRIPPEIDPGRHVEDQLSRLLAVLSEHLGLEPARATWQPRAAAWQDATGFEIAIDVPGVTRDQLAVRVAGQELVITGERRDPWDARELARPPMSHEVTFGRFARAFALPASVEPSQISARLENGVLRVRVVHRMQAVPAPVPIAG